MESRPLPEFRLERVMRLDSPREEEASLVLLLLVLLLLKTDVWFRFEYTELNRPFGSIAAADDCPLTLVQSRTVRTVKRGGGTQHGTFV